MCPTSLQLYFIKLTRHAPAGCTALTLVSHAVSQACTGRCNASRGAVPHVLTAHVQCTAPGCQLSRSNESDVRPRDERGSPQNNHIDIDIDIDSPLSIKSAVKRKMGPRVGASTRCGMPYYRCTASHCMPAAVNDSAARPRRGRQLQADSEPAETAPSCPPVILPAHFVSRASSVLCSVTFSGHSVTGIQPRPASASGIASGSGASSALPWPATVMEARDALIRAVDQIDQLFRPTAGSMFRLAA